MSQPGGRRGIPLMTAGNGKHEAAHARLLLAAAELLRAAAELCGGQPPAAEPAAAPAAPKPLRGIELQIARLCAGKVLTPKQIAAKLGKRLGSRLYETLRAMRKKGALRQEDDGLTAAGTPQE
jgi:hypothetical protein